MTLSTSRKPVANVVGLTHWSRTAVRYGALKRPWPSVFGSNPGPYQTSRSLGTPVGVQRLDVLSARMQTGSLTAPRRHPSHTSCCAVGTRSREAIAAVGRCALADGDYGTAGIFGKPVGK